MAPVATPDTIIMTDGSTLKNVTVVGETLLEVTYRPEGKTSEKTVKADQVLSVDFSRKPKDVDEADSAIADGNIGDGVVGLQDYLEAIAGGERERLKWAPAYARWRLVEVHRSVGDSKGVVTHAAKLIADSPESRYIPLAHLAKAWATAS